MHEIYKTNNSSLIAYKHYKSKKNLLCVVFLHGLMSDMTGTKSEYLNNYCISNDISFLTFDNLGCGKSSGSFQDQTMGNWFNTTLDMLSNFAPNEVILIGSSAGAWTALELAKIRPDIVKGLVCIAAAPDFTEKIWQNLSMEERTTLRLNSDICIKDYPISYKFVEEAKKHLLLNEENIDISCPVHLIHGVLDIVVPYTTSLNLCDKILSNSVNVKLIKDGDHRLSRTEDLRVINNSLEEVLHMVECA